MPMSGRNALVELSDYWPVCSRVNGGYRGDTICGGRESLFPAAKGTI